MHDRNTPFATFCFYMTNLTVSFSHSVSHHSQPRHTSTLSLLVYVYSRVHVNSLFWFYVYMYIYDIAENMNSISVVSTTFYSDLYKRPTLRLQSEFRFLVFHFPALTSRVFFFIPTPTLRHVLVIIYNYCFYNYPYC